MRLIGTAALGLSIGILAAMALLWSEGRFDPPEPGSVSFGEARLGGPFALAKSDGTTVTEKALLGRVTLLTFSFQACGAPCDVSLQTIAQALAEAPRAASIAEMDLQAVAIGLDPDRESATQFEAYVRPFADGDRLLALSGSRDDIRALALAYGLPLALESVRQSQDPLRGFLPPIYVLDRTGRYVTHVPFGTDVETIIKAISEANRTS